jgi:hypothetical protein
MATGGTSLVLRAFKEALKDNYKGGPNTLGQRACAYGTGYFYSLSCLREGLSSRNLIPSTQASREGEFLYQNSSKGVSNSIFVFGMGFGTRHPAYHRAAGELS